MSANSGNESTVTKSKLINSDAFTGLLRKLINNKDSILKSLNADPESLGRDEVFKLLENSFHNASLMAFIKSAYEATSSQSAPNLIYRLNPDTDIYLEELHGNHKAPQKDVIDVSLLDLLIASSIDDIQLVLYGGTGIGKTYPISKYLSATLNKDNYHLIKLSANNTSLITDFVTGEYVDNILRFKPNTDKINKTAGIFIDEANRASSQQLIPLLDGSFPMSGEEVRMGLDTYLIELDDNDELILKKNGHKKKPFIITAMNPSSRESAVFTETREVDGALKNRCSKIVIPEKTASNASSIVSYENGVDLHDNMIKLFAKYLTESLSIKLSESEEGELIDCLKDKWLNIYSYILNPARNEFNMNYSSYEFMGLATYLMGEDNNAVAGKSLLESLYNSEKSYLDGLIIGLNSKGINVDKNLINYRFQADAQVSNAEKVILDFIEKKMTSRDVYKTKELANGLALIKYYKTVKDPLNETLKSVSINAKDVMGALYIICSSKSQKEEPKVLLESLYKTYASIMKGVTGIDFNAINRDGIKKYLLDSAIEGALDKTNFYDSFKPEEFSRTLALEIANQAGSLNSLNKPLEQLIGVKCAGDLLTASNVVLDYEELINDKVKSYRDSLKPDDLNQYQNSLIFRELSELMATIKNKLEFPAQYNPRITQVFG